MRFREGKIPDSREGPAFWRAMWEQGGAPFTAAERGRLLAAHWPGLRVPAGSAVLVPLCGMSPDLTWLAAHGYAVTGVELSPLPCERFFADQRVVPERADAGAFVRWRGGNVTILQGDVFDLEERFPAILDRGGLVAFPPAERPRYASHLAARLDAGGVLLLVTVEYDAARRAGPPFPIFPEEVRRLFPAAVERSRAPLRRARWTGIGGADAVVWFVR